MRTKFLLRSLALAGAAATTTLVVSTPTASADPAYACSYFADCNSVNGHISSSTIISRAMKWINYRPSIPYSEYAHVNDTGANPAQAWRTDCSGFVSMAWRLSGTATNNYGLTTTTLQNVSVEISYTALQNGDILDDAYPGPGQTAHVIIFDGWASTVGGDFWMIEMNSYYGLVRHLASSVSYLQAEGIKGRNDNGDHYVPRRYNKWEPV